jgi:hypothetical protein
VKSLLRVARRLAGLPPAAAALKPKTTMALEHAQPSA